MSRIALAFALGGILAVSVAEAAEHPKFSGMVTAVTARSITLRELGGPGPSGNLVISRSFALGPETAMKLAARAEGEEAAEWPGGYKELSLTPADVRVGDFATVEAQRQDSRLTAISVVVVRP
jgi:hypothetical protein